MLIEVEPSALGAAGGSQAELAGRLTEISSRLTSAMSGSSGAGDPGLADAMAGTVQSWQASLAMLSDSVGGLAAGLSGASTAYSVTDESAIPAG
jgi:Excreted virulence factor EspC, type VII ESX diderm